MRGYVSIIVVSTLLRQTWAKPQFYEFGYQVDTLDTGDYHGHMEQLDGQVKRGEFKVRLPDGRLQVTSYQADDKGFRPKVSYEIDPLFVGPPPGPIAFAPEKKLVKRPPPKDYSAPEINYLPPSINYDPRDQILTPTPQPSYLPPSPKPTYLPPKPVTPPSINYLVPKINYETQQDLYTPLINYSPRGHHKSDDYHDLSYRRSDLDNERPNPANEDDSQHYYLVPVRAKAGSQPVLALLVKKRTK